MLLSSGLCLHTRLFPRFPAVRDLYTGRWLLMSSRSAQDARALARVVCVLVALAVVGDSHALAWPVQVAAGVAPLALGVLVLLLLGLTACRVVASRRSLASRTRLVVLAPDTFDPSVDAVLRCAAQLSRVRRLVGGWFDPRARAVRVLLDCDGEGRMRYSLSVPERALPAVRSALGVFDRVQAHVLDPGPEPSEATEREGTERGGAIEVGGAELRLARPSR